MDVTLNDGTRVTLADRLDFRSAQTITRAIALFGHDDPDMRTAAILAMVDEYYLVYGVTGWSLSQPVTADNIRKYLLTHPDVDLVVEAASDLYQGQVIDPLVRRASESSPPSQTDEPTSPTPSGTKRTRRPSKPSLTSITPTDVTVTTSSPPDGDSNYSPSLVSAAS